MKKLLTLFLGLLLAQPAWAAWQAFWESEWEGAKEITFLDPTTIRKTTDGRRIWTMMTNDSPRTFNYVTFQSVRHLIEIDCAGEKLRVLQQDFFSGPMLSGQIERGRGKSPGPWEYAAPGSFSMQQLKFVCKLPLPK